AIGGHLAVIRPCKVLLRGNRTVDDLDKCLVDIFVTSHNGGRGEHVLCVLHVADKTASFTNQHDTGCNIPWGKVGFPEAVNATGCNIGQVKRCSAHTANTRNFTHDVTQFDQELAVVATAQMRHAAGNDAIRQGL